MSHSEEKENMLRLGIDELTHYIFHNYRGFLSVAETAAFKIVVAEEKARRASTEEARRRLRSQFGSSGPAVSALLEKGPIEFLITARDRLLNEHANEIFINRCPKCGALARTPQACLCPACNHTWYDKRHELNEPG